MNDIEKRKESSDLKRFIAASGGLVSLFAVSILALAFISGQVG
jgi:hypothetical protein